MSHEIRTPLNAIVGFSDMLANEPEFSDEERQEFVDIINTNTKLLLKLVGDVLELSRIESGNLSFIFQRESVRQLLDDVYQTHSLLIQPPLQFLKDFPPEDVQVNVDPMRLTQVLTNFLNNANKFTKEGSIQLGYCCPSGMREDASNSAPRKVVEAVSRWCCLVLNKSLKKCNHIVMFLYIILRIFASVLRNITF